MSDETSPQLRRGWTTGACATAATKAALAGLWAGIVPTRVQITLPKGETPEFDIVGARVGDGWAEAGVVKDAGDDPDVTHGVTVVVRVAASTGGVVFKAGDGVGTVTKAGLPIPVGDPAINPVPRAMMDEEVAAAAVLYDRAPNDRGIDVARADGLAHVAGCTGNTSERVVQGLYGLPDHAMLDMGDFAGGMIKYMRRHPVGRLTIGGGIGKLTKLAQGAVDLHSGRSQVDFAALADWMEDPRLKDANTALEAYTIAGAPLAAEVAQRAQQQALAMFKGGTAPEVLDIVVIDRAGEIIGRAGP